MSSPEIPRTAQLGPSAWTLAQDPVERHLRVVRAYVLPLRGPSGYRLIPVTRFCAGAAPGLDIPLLVDIWSVDGATDERTIPVASHRGSRHRRWEMYTIWFLRPYDRDAPTNRGIQRLGITGPVAGEFVVFRRTADGYRLLDIRRSDHVGVEAAIMRLIGLLHNGDQILRAST